MRLFEVSAFGKFNFNEPISALIGADSVDELFERLERVFPEWKGRVIHARELIDEYVVDVRFASDYIELEP